MHLKMEGEDLGVTIEVEDALGKQRYEFPGEPYRHINKLHLSMFLWAITFGWKATVVRVMSESTGKSVEGWHWDSSIGSGDVEGSWQKVPPPIQDIYDEYEDSKES